MKESKEVLFRRLYRDHAQQLYGVAYRMVQNREDASDIVQEVFRKAYCGWHTFLGTARVSTWLYRIAVNLSYDLLRRRQRRKVERLDPTFDIKGSHFSGEKEVREQDILDHVKEEIERLTEKQKLVFILRTYQELPYKEIAQITRSRIGTVKATYFQTMEKIRRNLKQKGVLDHAVRGM